MKASENKIYEYYKEQKTFIPVLCFQFSYNTM